VNSGVEFVYIYGISVYESHLRFSVFIEVGEGIVAKLIVTKLNHSFLCFKIMFILSKTHYLHYSFYTLFIFVTQ